MKSIQSLLFCSLALLVATSCGTSREVRYVYVNPPQQQASPQVNNYTVQSHPAPEYTSSRAASSYSSSGSSSSAVRDCLSLSQESAPGKVRGYGLGKSTDLPTANALAKASAKQDLIDNFRAAVNDLLERNMTSTNGETVIRAKRDFEQRFTGVLPLQKTICSNTKRGAMNEIEICVEIDLKDIVAVLEPILRGYAPQDRDAIKGKLMNE